MNAIYATALKLLSDLGMGEVPERLELLFLSKGAFLNNKGRTCFPRAMVEDAIDKAAKRFPLHGRDPDRTIEVGGDDVHFGTGGAAVQTLDLHTASYRPSTLQDLYDFTRLQDTLPNVSWFTRCCVATDVPDNFDLDVNTVYALMRGTTKPVATSFTLAEYVAPHYWSARYRCRRAGRFPPNVPSSKRISPPSFRRCATVRTRLM